MRWSRTPSGSPCPAFHSAKRPAAKPGLRLMAKEAAAGSRDHRLQRTALLCDVHSRGFALPNRFDVCRCTLTVLSFSSYKSRRNRGGLVCPRVDRYGLRLSKLSSVFQRTLEFLRGD